MVLLESMLPLLAVLLLVVPPPLAVPLLMVPLEPVVLRVALREAVEKTEISWLSVFAQKVPQASRVPQTP